MISWGGGGGMAVRIMQQDIIILLWDRDECLRVVGILVMVE